MRKVRLASAVVCLALSFGLTTASPPSNRRALWVWTDEISTAAAREALVDRAAQSCFDSIYISVYRFPPNSDGDRMYERSDLGALLALAHAAGIEIRVWTAYGEPGWPELCVNLDCSCKASCFLWDRIDEYNRFNADWRFQEFDGWMFDVEPTSPDARLLGLYDCARQRIEPASLLGAVLRFWWHPPDINEIRYPCGSGRVAPIYEHAIGTLHLDRVIVMCYRDFAEGFDGIIDLCEEEAGYAADIGRTQNLEVGLETQCGGVLDKESFCEEGAASMECAISSVRQRLTVRGFAINQYNRSVLEGSLPWPAYDPSACEVETLTVSHDKTNDATTVSWPSVPPAISYDIVRGELSLLREMGGLGDVDKIADRTTETSVVDNCPWAGLDVYYLQRLQTVNALGSYGESSDCQPRTPTQEFPCP